jgi:hypothetical protein
VLADIPGAGWRKRAESDEITLYGESKSMTSPEFGESRRRIERALGPELLRQLKVSRDWHPIP